MRNVKIAIDGPPGSGKTTLLSGNNNEYSNSLESRGYFIWKESTSKAVEEMMVKKIDNFLETDEFMKKILKHEKEHHEQSTVENIYFFDRGLPGYDFIVEDLNPKWLPKFKEASKKYRYYSHVFIFKPIITLKEVKKGGPQGKVFNIKERIMIYEKMRNEYIKRGYKVIDVPLVSYNLETSNEKRIQFILAKLKELKVIA